MTKMTRQAKHRLLSAVLPAWLLCSAPGTAQEEEFSVNAVSDAESDTQADTQADTAISTEAISCNPDFTPAPHGYDFIYDAERAAALPEGSRIGNLHYTRLPVFDETNPAENNFLFRFGNKFHIMTWEKVVEDIVLIEEGQLYDERLVQETERLLRQQNMFWDADLRLVSVCDDAVDIEVITRDTWSFTPGVGYDRSGGDDTYSVNIRESNILGSGKLVSLGRKSDTDRVSTELIYEDNNIFGSRVRGELTFIDSDDGYEHAIDLGLPFFALDTQRAWQIKVREERRIDSQFYRGDDVTEVQHDIDEVSLRYGFSRGLREGRVQRWYVGYQYLRERFAPGDELPLPAVFPREQTLSYPFLSYESIEDHYVASFNVDQIYRTEDLHVGSHFYHRMGYSASGLGADQDRIVMDGFFTDTLIHEDGVLLRNSLEWEGQWNLDTERSEDIRVSWQSEYLHRRSERHAFYASLQGVWTHNLNSHEQVTLGGLEGARGYENRFQVGDRRLLLTLEQRLYTNIHILNLVRLGGAVFMDVGRAWEPGVDSGMEDKALANIGFGLRMTSSKSSTRRMAHLDFAFPVTNRNDSEVSEFEVAFNVKSTF